MKLSGQKVHIIRIISFFSNYSMDVRSVLTDTGILVSCAFPCTSHFLYHFLQSHLIIPCFMPCISPPARDCWELLEDLELRFPFAPKLWPFLPRYHAPGAPPQWGVLLNHCLPRGLTNFLMNPTFDQKIWENQDLVHEFFVILGGGKSIWYIRCVGFAKHNGFTWWVNTSGLWSACSSYCKQYVALLVDSNPNAKYAHHLASFAFPLLLL